MAQIRLVFSIKEPFTCKKECQDGCLRDFHEFCDYHFYSPLVVINTDSWPHFVNHMEYTFLGCSLMSQH
jgi:hypothetical protein